MSEPVRLQISRRKGFDLQALSRATNGLPAAKVTRGPGARWGNPYKVEKVRRSILRAWDWDGRATHPMWASVMLRGEAVKALQASYDRIAAQAAVDIFATEAAHFARTDAASFAAWIAPLRGKNLACWCKLDAPCHADVLLELANRPVCEEVRP